MVLMISRFWKMSYFRIDGDIFMALFQPDRYSKGEKKQNISVVKRH